METNISKSNTYVPMSNTYVTNSMFKICNDLFLKLKQEIILEFYKFFIIFAPA